MLLLQKVVVWNFSSLGEWSISFVLWRALSFLALRICRNIIAARNRRNIVHQLPFLVQMWKKMFDEKFWFSNLFIFPSWKYVWVYIVLFCYLLKQCTLVTWKFLISSRQCDKKIDSNQFAFWKPSNVFGLTQAQWIRILTSNLETYDICSLMIFTLTRNQKWE